MRQDDKRGSSADRRRRKAWLLATFTACVWCNGSITEQNVHADRIQAGGSYARRNLIAACAACNMRRKDTPVCVFIGLCAAPEHALEIFREIAKGFGLTSDIIITRTEKGKSSDT